MSWAYGIDYCPSSIGCADSQSDYRNGTRRDYRVAVMMNYWRAMMVFIAIFTRYKADLDVE